MSQWGTKTFRAGLLGAVAVTAVTVAPPGWAQAQERQFDLAAQSANSAIPEFARQADIQILVAESAVHGRRTNAVKGRMSVAEGLKRLLSGTGLRVASNDGRTVTLAADPQSGDGASDQGVAVSEVVVTGSYIPGARGASPVQVVDRKHIDQSGYTSTQQVVAALPQNWGGGVTELTMNGQVSQSVNGLPGDAAANIHGLGARATLTLLDGHRMASSGFGSYADLSAVPLSAVDRVEVLTDGASALYGSDAVAGVVNIVLRKHLSGLQTEANYGSVTRGGRTQGSISQAAGLDWSNGSGLLSYSYDRRTGLASADRSFTPAGAAGSDLMPATETQSVFGVLNQSVSETLALYATGLYSHKTSDTTDVLFGNTGSTSDQYAVFGGGRLTLSPAWTVDLSANLARNRMSFIQSGPFGVSGNYLETSTDNSLLLLVNGDLFTLPAGPLKVALGAEYRRQGFNLRNRLSHATTDLHRDVGAVFAELNIPLVSSDNTVPFADELTLSAAGRYERYSDFGSTTNPKFGLRWKPTPDLLLRATTGTSFNAPTLYTNNGISQGVPFPLTDPSAPGGSTVALVLLGSKSHLRPETSRTNTFGLDYAPAALPGLRVSATWFETLYKGKLQSPSSNFTGMLVNAGDYGGLIVRNPSAAQVSAAIAGVDQFINPFGFPNSAITAIVDDRLQNVAVVRVRGWDFEAAYRTDLAGGQAGVEFNAEHLESFDQQITPAAAAIDVANTVYNPPSWRLRTDLSWSRGGFAVAGAVNYVGDYTNNAVAPSRSVGAFTTVDMQVSYRFGGASWPTSGLSIAFSVQNLFDADPPAIAGSLSGYDPTNASPLGRFVTLRLSKRW